MKIAVCAMWRIKNDAMMRKVRDRHVAYPACIGAAVSRQSVLLDYAKAKAKRSRGSGNLDTYPVGLVDMQPFMAACGTS